MSTPIGNLKIQPVDDFFCFAVFHGITKELMYSKYNFNFNYFKNSNLSEFRLLNNSQLFHKFLVLNETDLTQPFSVKDEYEKYFNYRIGHANSNDREKLKKIQDYFDDYGYFLRGLDSNYLSSYVNWNTILENQFNYEKKYNFLTDFPNICEFLFTEPDTGLIYSKYNFNFIRYSEDFCIYGSKSTIFYDFLVRLHYLTEETTLTANSLLQVKPIKLNTKYIPSQFKKYFYTSTIQQNTLIEYLTKYGVFSVYDKNTKSFPNIDFNDYLLKRPELKSVQEAKIYFIKYGQFQQDVIQFVKNNIDEYLESLKSVCSVVTGSTRGTGFLIKGPTNYDIINNVKQIYVVTCYHNIANSKSKDIFYANCYYNEKKNLKLMFRVIGFDINSDVCIGIYDDNLDYNKNNFPEDIYDIRNTLKTYELYDIFELKIGGEIITMGNPSLIDNDSIFKGQIADVNFGGSFRQRLILSYPPTILTNIMVTSGQSGSPCFIRDNDNTLKIVGMLNSRLGDNLQYSMVIKYDILKQIINTGISNWFNYIQKYTINDIENISFLIQDITQKKWLGATFLYYNQSYSSINPIFEKLSVNAGIIIERFILGFNINSKQFVYDYAELTQQGVIKIDGPLLNSGMHKKFLFTGNQPIVITEISYMNKLLSLGKYNIQNNMDIFTYNFKEINSVNNDPKYMNSKYNTYSSIIFTYYYYNGNLWVKETEEIGANTSSWFNEYKDSFGHLFLQHKWEVPQILIPYLGTFTSEKTYIKPPATPVKPPQTPTTPVKPPQTSGPPPQTPGTDKNQPPPSKGK